MIQKENYKISLEEHKLIGQTNNCTAAHNYLCRSFRANTEVKKDFDRQTPIKKSRARVNICKFE